jgi:hypothetical protein
VLLELDFLQFQPRLRLSTLNDLLYVYDPIRRKDIVLQPEELVRQLVLLHLLEEKKYPANRVRVEIGIELNGLRKRCDIVVFDSGIKPWLLIECKSPKVPVTQSTFEQAARYNLKLQAPFMMSTNGLTSYCAQLDFEQRSFIYLPDFPDFPDSERQP